jgi:hypothetical protein
MLSLIPRGKQRENWLASMFLDGTLGEKFESFIIARRSA